MRQQEINDALLNQHQGTENPLAIWREMGETMTENVTVIRYNANLQKTLTKLRRTERALPENQSAGSHAVGEPNAEFRPRTWQHAGAREGDHAGCARAQRNARRTLQTRFPESRRRQLAEDDQRRALRAAKSSWNSSRWILRCFRCANGSTRRQSNFNACARYGNVRDAVQVRQTMANSTTESTFIVRD